MMKAASPRQKVTPFIFMADDQCLVVQNFYCDIILIDVLYEKTLPLFCQIIVTFFWPNNVSLLDFCVTVPDERL